MLPCMEIDGRFITESETIQMELERLFPERPLLPTSPALAQKASELLQLERSLFGAWLKWLRGEESAQARKQFEAAMDSVERSLAAAGPYFMGADISLPDLIFASTLERIAGSILYYKGLQVKGGRWTHVNRWFQAIESRDSYKATYGDFHTNCHDLPPQIGGCIPSGSAEQRAIAAEIDGTDGKSWRLPLAPLSQTVEPWPENEQLDKLEAANAMVHCHAGVMKSSKASESGDAAFRMVTTALLEGIANVPEAELRKLDPAAAASLRWTRDRISVPRDMSFPAARQLRAHLNWAADILDPRDSWTGVAFSAQSRKDMDPVNFGCSV